VTAQAAASLRHVGFYWNIGKRIREDVRKDKRADYGKAIVSTLSKQLTAEYGENIVRALSAQLTAEYGRGYGRRNLFKMIQSAEYFSD